MGWRDNKVIKTCATNIRSGKAVPNRKIDIAVSRLSVRVGSLRNAQQVSQSLNGLLTAGRVMELAEAGYMPCYRIDGGPMLFDLDEVANWVMLNLIQKTEGMSFPRVIPIPMRECSACNPPVELSKIKNLQRTEFPDFPPCVYFLVEAQKVVYVGQTIELMRRIGDHKRDKSFDAIFWIPVPVSELNTVEGAFIRLLQPPLNGYSRYGTAKAPAGDAETDMTILTEYTEIQSID